MNKLIPILRTKNLEETISFYENVLGFRGKSNFPNFVSLSKGDAEIMFIAPQEESFQKPELTGSLYIWMENLDEFWETIKDKVQVTTAIDNRQYNARDFSILDNNGYELAFGENNINT